MKSNKIIKSDSNIFTNLTIGDSRSSFIDNTTNVIRTDDFCLAVTIFHTGARLLSVNKENPDKLIFIFKKISNFEDVKDEFFSDLLTVKSFSFLESIKAFKRRIDSEQNNNNNSK